MAIIYRRIKNYISFNKKDEFNKKAEQYNVYRINAVHKMRRSNLTQLSKELDKVKSCFIELYNLYDEIQDSFRVDFHGFKKDVFIDYLTEEDREQYFG